MNLLKKEIGVLKGETRYLSKMTQSTELNFDKMQSNINSFKERFAALEEEMVDLAYKIQSMTARVETLFERI